MTKNRLKHLYDKKPDEKACSPLLNKEAEQQRLYSIEQEKKKIEELNKRAKNLQNIFKGVSK